MVIKGSARGSPGGLAKHLGRTDTNERMALKEVRGLVAEDLAGALHEMDALGAALRTWRTLYHASINTAPDERMGEAEWKKAIDRLEAEMDLTGQPRVVVMHEKEGREHRHIVWSRTDLEHMRAIRCDHNYRKHELVARQLEREFGHRRVQGAHAERDGVERPERTPSHAEQQQGQRTGLTPKEAKAWITTLWQATDSGKAFAAALESQGWMLAQGDRRDFVAIDPHGELHSLARRVEGAKAKDIRERLADIDRASLPTAEAAQAIQKGHTQDRVPERAGESQQPVAATPTPEPQPNPAPSPPERDPAVLAGMRWEDQLAAAGIAKAQEATAAIAKPDRAAAPARQAEAAQSPAAKQPEPTPAHRDSPVSTPAREDGANAGKAADRLAGGILNAIGGLADFLVDGPKPPPSQAEQERQAEAAAAAAQAQEVEAAHNEARRKAGNAAAQGGMTSMDWTAVALNQLRDGDPDLKAREDAEEHERRRGGRSR